MRQFTRFIAAGGTATIAHYLILTLLVQRGWAAVAATSCGSACGALIGYWLNHRYTFNSRRAHSEALPRHLATAAGGLLINGAVVGVLVNVRVHYLLAQGAATALVLVANFLVNRWWIFRGDGYAQ